MREDVPILFEGTVSSSCDNSWSMDELGGRSCYSPKKVDGGRDEEESRYRLSDVTSNRGGEKGRRRRRVMRDGQSITPLAMTMMMNVIDRDDIKSPKEEMRRKKIMDRAWCNVRYNHGGWETRTEKSN